MSVCVCVSTHACVSARTHCVSVSLRAFVCVCSMLALDTPNMCTRRSLCVRLCAEDLMERYYIITISPPLAILGDFL